MRAQALQLKEAELLAAKQSVRSAVAEHMKSTPASELCIMSQPSPMHVCVYVSLVHTSCVTLAVSPEGSSLAN